jgi:hypothetical protein
LLLHLDAVTFLSFRSIVRFTKCRYVRECLLAVFLTHNLLVEFANAGLLQSFHK